MTETRYGGDGHETCAICSEVIAVSTTPLTVASNPEYELALAHEHDDARIVEGEYIGETKAEAEARRHAFSRDFVVLASIKGGLGAKHAAHPSDCLAFVIQGCGSGFHSNREYLTHDLARARWHTDTLCSEGFTVQVTEYLGSAAGETTIYEPVWANE